MKDGKSVGLRLRENVIEKLKEEAGERYLSVSDVIREAISEHVRKRENAYVPAYDEANDESGHSESPRNYY